MSQGSRLVAVDKLIEFTSLFTLHYEKALQIHSSRISLERLIATLAIVIVELRELRRVPRVLQIKKSWHCLILRHSRNPQGVVEKGILEVVEVSRITLPCGVIPGLRLEAIVI